MIKELVQVTKVRPDAITISDFINMTISRMDLEICRSQGRRFMIWRLTSAMPSQKKIRDKTDRKKKREGNLSQVWSYFRTLRSHCATYFIICQYTYMYLSCTLKSESGWWNCVINTYFKKYTPVTLVTLLLIQASMVWSSHESYTGLEKLGLVLAPFHTPQQRFHLLAFTSHYSESLKLSPFYWDTL